MFGVGNRSGPDGFTRLPEESQGKVRGSDTSIKQKAKDAFRQLKEAVVGQKEPLPTHVKVAKLDKQIEELKSKQSKAKEGGKTWEKISNKLDKMVTERNRLKPQPRFTQAFGIEAAVLSGPNQRSSLKDLHQLKAQINKGDVGADSTRLYVMADKLGQGLLQFYGYQGKERVSAFLEAAFVKVASKQFAADDCIFMLNHIKNTYSEHRESAERVQQMVMNLERYKG